MFQYNFYRPANVIFLKNGCGTQKFPISAFQSHLQTKNNLHIFILQSQFISAISISDTIAVNGWSNFLFSNFWHFWFPNFATKKQNCLHCERPGSQLVRESRQKFPSLLEKLFFFFLAYFDIVPRPLAPRNESGGRPLFLCRAVGTWRRALGERPLMTADIRVGRGSKIAPKIGRYRVGQGR